jgi:hypothetical protein
MAAIESKAIGWLLNSHNLVMPFVLLAASYALGTLCWFGVDVTQTLAQDDATDPTSVRAG